MLDDSDIQYYRRRAAAETANADSAAGEREREIHRELAALYATRADLHERQAKGAAERSA